MLCKNTNGNNITLQNVVYMFDLDDYIYNLFKMSGEFIYTFHYNTEVKQA